MLNALPICCYVFLSVIFLIQARDFKALWKNFLSFCAGFVIIVLPFVIYFAAHNVLYDMLYGTILLNVMYSAQRENFLLTHLDEFATYIILHFIPLYLMILVSTMELIKDKSRLAMSGLFCSVIMLFMLFKLSPYSGYCALNTPLLLIFFVLLVDFAKKFHGLWFTKRLSLKHMLCKIMVGLLMLYPLILLGALSIRLVNKNSDFINDYDRKEFAEMNRLAELIPTEERNSLMIWGEGTHVSHWILTTGIFPRCRFFGNVKAFANVDPNVKQEWFENARYNSPQWMIYSAPESEFTGDYPDDWTKHFRQNRDVDVERLLQERYNLVDEMKTYQNYFRLYRLKE